MIVAKWTFPSTSVGQSVVSKSCSFFPFIYSLIYICTGSSFPAPVLESAISWKSPGSFKWREHLNPRSGCSVCACVCVCVCVYVYVSCSVVAGSLQPHGLQFTRLLCLWNSPGKNIGVGCHSLLQGFSVVTGNLKYTHARAWGALPHKSSGREFKIQRMRERRYFGSWSSLGFAWWMASCKSIPFRGSFGSSWWSGDAGCARVSQELTWKEFDQGASAPWCLEKYHTGLPLCAAERRGSVGAAEMTKCQGSWSLHPGLEPFGLGKVIDFLGGSEHGGEGLSRSAPH